LIVEARKKEGKKRERYKKVEEKKCGNHFPSHFEVSNFVTILIQPSILAFYKLCNAGI